MRQSIILCLIACMLLTLAPAAGAVEYQAMPEIDVEQYQPAPMVQVLFDSGTIQEIPAEYVLMKDGKVYLGARAFGLIPNLMAFDQLNGQPVAVVRTLLGEDQVMIYCKVQQPGEQKAFFVETDGNTYLPLRETCETFGVKLTLQDNVITLQR